MSRSQLSPRKTAKLSQPLTYIKALIAGAIAAAGTATAGGSWWEDVIAALVAAGGVFGIPNAEVKE